MSRIDVLKKAYNDNCVCVKVSGWSVLKRFYITMGLSKIFLLMPLLSC